MPLRSIWEYRELLYFLIWRDVKLRYKQTAFGVAWVVVQPLLTAVLFTAIFGRFAGLPSDGAPYALFALAGLVPWLFFSSALARGGTSLVQSANLITKIYFPRAIIPLASVAAGLVDLGVGLLLLFALIGAYGVTVGVAAITLPFFVALAILAAVGISLGLSALNVRYRDVGALIPFLTQMWLFSTPVAYSIRLIPPQWRFLFDLNPMAGVVEGFRWALLGTTPLPFQTIATSGLSTVLMFASGVFLFRRMERRFADVV